MPTWTKCVGGPERYSLDGKQLFYSNDRTPRKVKLRVEFNITYVNQLVFKSRLESIEVDLVFLSIRFYNSL